MLNKALGPPSKGIFDTASLLGIPSPLTLCKANALPNIIGVSSEKIPKLKSSEKKSNHAKHSEKTKSASNNLSTSVSSGVSIISGNVKTTSKKSSEGLGEQIVQLLAAPEKSAKRKSKPKSSKNEAARNGKKSAKEKKTRKPKEKKLKKSSSESEGHLESGSSSTGADTSNAVSSSSSGSSDEEEREKQQKKLAKLKKQQQELRRQVQELKQASHDSVHPKPEMHVKKVSSNPKIPLGPSGPINHTVKPVPSPAHSLLPTPSKAISPETVKICDPVLDEEQNSAFPLDLCMKKQEPTFEVTTSVLSSYIPSVTTAVAKKKPYQNVVRNAGTSNNKAAVPRKRGRKPKPNQMLTNVSVPEPEKVRQRQRHSIKDITSMFMSPKMDLLPSQVSSPSLLKTNNSNTCPKVHAPNTLTNSNDILPHPRKNFTLDSLLSETNGNLDIYHHYPDMEKAMYPGSLYGAKNQKPKERVKSNSNSISRTKKYEEKIKESESPSQFETSSPSDSDPDDDNSDSDDSDQSHSEALADGGLSYGSHKRKRSYNEDGEDYRNKKKRIVPDEREIQIPLEHGWRRETRVRCFSRSGVRGEVTYYAPCGKKLRSYPEVERYLIKNGITDISRDNFTFSTKVNIGEFLESTSSGSGQDYVLLNEQEVIARIEEAKVRKGRLGVQNRKSSGGRSAEEEEQQRQWEQKQIQHHIEQQAEESRKQKEQQRMIKQQEKFERMEQMRIEREIRAQQLLEEQEMKRQQAVFLREQERERRRQHMILVRALENRKKQEERERKREEILFEKRINREKKMEQRRIELDYLRELKKPVDDMMLKDLMPLPNLNRIPGVKLCGKAFADILMVFEFLHNFGETLGFDMESLPTLNTMQCALLNLDEKCEEEMMSVVHHLLVCAIDDPGVPHNSESATVLGQNLKDADITNNNVSEVLRLYFIAQDKRSPMLEWLQIKPFLSLNPSQKAEIIAYLCDELLTSRLLTRQIDSNIENVNVLRKDKWLVEGDLRRYRSIQQRRALKARLSAMEENRDNPNCANMLSADLPDFSLATQKDNPTANDDPDMKDISKCDKEKLDDIESELANESGNESDDTQAPGQISEGEDEDLHLSNDEINKKIEKLSKQLTQCSNKLTKAFYTIRGATFGMDRYHRRYWVLPKSGGVFVESMESSLKAEERERVLSSSQAAKVKIESGLETLSFEGNKECEMKDVSPSPEKSDQESKVPVIDGKGSEKPDLQVEKLPTPIPIKEECENIEKTTESASMKSDQVVKCEEDPKSDIKKEVNQADLANSEQVTSNTKLSVSEEEEPVVQQNKVCDTDKEKGSKTVVEENETQKSDKSVVNNPETNLEDKSSMPAIKHNELKLNPLEMCNTDNKSLPDFQFSQKKKIWTVDKGDYNNTPMPPIKKENDTKIKKERSKESDKKYDRSDIKEDKKSNVNIFMPNFNENINLDLGASKLHGGSDRSHAPNPSMPPDQNWLLHSPLFASILAGNMLFNGPLVPQREMNGTYFNLPKNDSNNPFGPFLGLQQGMLSEQIFKSLGEKPNSQKPWFSILPRMPCDESLLSTTQPPRNPNVHPPCDARSSSNRSNHSPVNANMQPGQVASALSNLQMELMNGVPPGFFLHPFLPPQFGPTYQSSSPVTCSSHHSASFTSTLSHTSPMHDFGLSFGRSPEVSTPNSIPTPSATPGPGCTTPTSRDSPSPGFTKRFLMEKMTQEYEAPQPISVELQRGWWRIDDPNQLKTIISALHHRGVREKMFQKQLQKHFQFACTSCSQGRSEETTLQLTELDEEISKLPGAAPDQDSPSFWYRNIALRIDMAILEQVENLEEKVDGSSMQVKFWKPPTKLSTEPLSKFVPSCEMYVHRKADDIYDAIKDRTLRKGAKKNSSKKKKPVKKEIELEEIEKKPEDEPLEPVVEGEAPEANEPIPEEPEKPCPEEKIEDKIESDVLPLPSGMLNPVEEAKKRLLKVEAAIERRYLRPPLGINANDLSRSSLTSSNNTSANQSGAGEGADEDQLPVVPPGLLKWRNAVQNCRTAAQLAMCLNFLETCTAWDKSIMRASCQFCHSGDNEEKLLLCDGCDKGYHTYCFKPVMETIPDGDWYCFECLNKATGDNVCVICGIKGKLVECETCPKTFHLTCLEPPLAK
ncbi:bromodomain adjacent to zinc finger domain protein 2B-like [Uloborus diversus]|uniref:bromodomain adjacent to zinc finger domain protein 2B-like n=1 Tax=Uloborus diversus TaxID=327109 RepID=UPI00240A0A17|nr:bromodomain adjacent to zinc finger domain protein 2B-like [Uloborus diversus]